MAFDTTQPAQLTGLQGYTLDPLFTVGESIPTASGSTYTPPGILDGIGAFALNDTTVRVLVTHELRPDRGYAYNVSDGNGGQFSLTGARISYFDVDKATLQITDAGLAYSEIYDATGTQATSASFLHNNSLGLNRFCSAQLVEAQQFGAGKGLVDRIFFANEETGGNFDPVGGGVWALDTATGEFWHVPAFGRGGWENVTEVDTGTTTHVAFILGDDTSPFNAGGDTATEAAPLYLYVGQKNASGNFLDRNGLSGGTLYVWVSSDSTKTRPEHFNTNGTTQAGSWVAIDNSRNVGQASETGANGYDEYGYPTQKTLWQRAEAAQAFQFSRPEDVATNPANGKEFVLASTGVAGLAAGTAGAGDTDGTLYTMVLDFTNLSAPTGTLKVLYSGDTDSTEALRNPDNLDWADDGYIYVQEDRANGAALFTAVNSAEAGIVRINPATGAVVRIANIDRSAVPSGQTDNSPTDVGNWESSGIVDVSKLFGQAAGTLFLADVQAHSLTNQGALSNNNLVEGGQLLLLKAPGYAVTPTAPTPANTLTVATKGTVTGSGAEIVAHDPGTQRLFVVSGTNILEILDIASGTPTLLSQTINVASVGGLAGGTANSVAVKNGIVAVAVQSGTKTNNGVVAFYNASDLSLVKTVTVGALPDMLTFTPDGTKVLVANEGESADPDNKPTGSPNPDGSISIIDLSNGVANATETKITFGNVVTTINQQVVFNGTVLNDGDGSLADGDVRFSPGVFTGALTPAQDLEPEYIAVSPDGTRAFVTLQENNAVAIVDLTTNSLVAIKSLWATDPAARKLAVLDSSDRDGGTYFRDWSSLPIYSLYMPDSVAAFTGSNGQTYFITANEGDARGEDKRIKDIILDPTIFPDAAYLQRDDKLGRLNVSSTDGDTDGDGDFDELYAYGDRSFAIWDANGNLVFDSGSQLEAIVAQATPTFFNANNGNTSQVDTRSDDKGPEPEAITVGLINGKPYAFVGLERAGGGVLIYDLSDPTNPVFDQYIRTEGDISPEGFKFISAEDSPTGKPMLAVANEVSKTTTLYEIETPTPPSDDFGFDPNEPGSGGFFKALTNLSFELKIKVNTAKIKTASELVIFEVDDAAGSVDGQAVGSSRYLEAILAGGKVLGSLNLLAGEGFNASGLPGGLDLYGFSQILDLVAGQRFGFLLVENGHLGDANAKVSYSNASSFNVAGFGAEGFDLSFAGSDLEFSLEIEAKDYAPGLAKKRFGLQTGRDFLELLDRRGEDGLTGQVRVFSEAAFDNLVGFYRTDTTGNILGSNNQVLAQVGASNYFDVLIQQAQTLAIELKSTTNASFLFTGGSILSPFIIADGDFGDYSADRIFTPFRSVNRDGVDHFRLLGSTTFAVEDQVGGGDQDFDDMIIQVTFA